MITSNVLALWKSKDVIVWMIRVTRHENWHSIIEIYNNVNFFVKFLIAEKTFEKILGRDSGNNGESTNIDLFQKGIAVLVGGIPLQNYICQA